MAHSAQYVTLRQFANYLYRKKTRQLFASCILCNLREHACCFRWSKFSSTLLFIGGTMLTSKLKSFRDRILNTILFFVNLRNTVIHHNNLQGLWGPNKVKAPVDLLLLVWSDSGQLCLDLCQNSITQQSARAEVVHRNVECLLHIVMVTAKWKQFSSQLNSENGILDLCRNVRVQMKRCTK